MCPVCGERGAMRVRVLRPALHRVRQVSLSVAVCVVLGSFALAPLAASMSTRSISRIGLCLVGLSASALVLWFVLARFGLYLSECPLCGSSFRPDGSVAKRGTRELLAPSQGQVAQRVFRARFGQSCPFCRRRRRALVCISDPEGFRKYQRWVLVGDVLLLAALFSWLPAGLLFPTVAERLAVVLTIGFFLASLCVALVIAPQDKWRRLGTLRCGVCNSYFEGAPWQYVWLGDEVRGDVSADSPARNGRQDLRGD